MANPANWEHGSTVTLRLPESLKQRIWEEAKAADLAPSAYIREKLSRGQLPEDIITGVSERNIALLEKWARREGRSVADEVSRLLPMSLSAFLDKQPGRRSDLNSLCC